MKIFKLAEEIICEPEDSTVCYPSWVTEEKTEEILNRAQRPMR